MSNLKNTIVLLTDLFFLGIKYKQIANLKGIDWLLCEGSFYLNLLRTFTTKQLLWNVAFLSRLAMAATTFLQ